MHLFARLTALATLALIFAGGMVTSTGSGLSVPDWPNSYGRFMFAFPLSDMVGGIVFEHTHRLIASGVGFLTMILAAWLWRKDSRLWVRRLGLVALAAVIVQGILGGMTVLFQLPTPISVMHAALAQTFFLITLTLAYISSREFIGDVSPGEDRASIASIRRWTFWTVGIIYGQLIIGAIMRHTGSGLAYTDFPLMGGAIWPAFDAATIDGLNWGQWQAGLAETTRGQMMIHFLHRLTAIGVSIGVIGMATKIFQGGSATQHLRSMAIVAVVLLSVQITLGAITVLSLKQPWFTSAHVVNGAALLGWCYLLLMRSQHALQFNLLPSRDPSIATEGMAV